MSDVEEVDLVDFDAIKLQFPFSKIRGICQLDPDLDGISAEAVKLIGKATEYFIEELATASYTQAILEKRKTVNKKDIDKVIEIDPTFEFLEDALDEWLEDVLDKTTEEDKENEEMTAPNETDEVMDEMVPLPATINPNSHVEELF
ncbi:unnamed protein product, partial [Mesorhabditis belari]|uniref:Nuclear transcription factor Y subunit gamma n=1 Tax=Mesorhabditis belari TaxID=2138241 RepID=A0AAF3EEH4_9BILA